MSNDYTNEINTTHGPRARTRATGRVSKIARPAIGGLTAVAVAGSLAVAFGTPAPAATGSSVQLVKSGAAWHYLDSGSEPGAGWTGPGFDDSRWAAGASQLGYGDGDEATKVHAGKAAYYFRTTFAAPTAGTVSKVTLSAMVDDGAAVYLNGTQVWRNNLPAVTTAKSLASAYVAGNAEKAWHTISVPVSALRAGSNTVAVEVHNNAVSSSDITFDAKLDAEVAASAGSESAPPAVAPPALTADTTRAVCGLDNPKLPEISGLASSIRYPGLLWTHNDSGDTGRIFGIDATTCAIRAEVTLAGVKPVDTESIGVGRNAAGQPTIWLGDTGDNARARSSVKLYEFPEPAVLGTVTTAVKTHSVTYNDGRRDAEGLMVDPKPGGTVWIVSKEANGGLYRLPANLADLSTAVATRVGPVRGFLTDAAYAPDGSRFIVRSGNVGTKFLAPAPGSSATSVNFPTQVQGEAITYSQDSTAVYIATEGKGDLIRIPVSKL